MPSYVIHLSCAKRALEMLSKMNAQEQNAFSWKYDRRYVQG